MFNKQVWKDGESLVANYMRSHGYKIVYQNFNCKIAELDIVAILPKKVQKQNLKKEYKKRLSEINNKEEKLLLKFSIKNQLSRIQDILIVTEVKSRSSDKFGTGVDAVSNNKIMHMKRGAEVLLKMNKFKNMQVRFDVASVDDGKIKYIEGAF